MMDKENGRTSILLHFVAQHKISIKLITLKIYGTTTPDSSSTKVTMLAPHEHHTN